MAAIHFTDLSKSYHIKNLRKPVLERLNFTLPGDGSVALLGRNGAGKSTLMRLIAGTLRPDRGQVISSGTISWPVGFGGSFHPELTGAQNVRFIARIYGIDTDALSNFVADFAELGAHFHLPVRSYSHGMRARLAFGASMGIRFDTYLVDEVTAVGDAAFRRKSRAVFRERLQQSNAIVVSHDLAQLRDFCTAGMVLENARLHYFSDLEQAIRLHQEMLA